MLRAAFHGDLDTVAYETEPVFGLAVPTSCPDVPSEVLMPRGTWSDPAEYDRTALALKAKFDAQSAKFA
jgi:phosphoenolpyruvate carboxykinase (ATP)